jgi:putative DNA primase/helicase
MDTVTAPAMAAAYAARGWPVIPLHSPVEGRCDCRTDCGKNAAKHPRTIHGVLDATSQADTVARWWRMSPGANIGIATGASSGLVVLDVDPGSGGDCSLARLLEQHGGLPETPCVRTGGGGLHFYFAHPGGVVRNSAGKLGRGIDVRGDGGYIVAPPSTHICGERYVWATACAPVALPAWLIDEATAAPVLSVSTEDALGGFTEGERDDKLFRLACKLRRVDMPRDVALEIVLRAAAACRPPFSADAALRKVLNAYERYAPATAVAAVSGRATRLVNLR